MFNEQSNILIDTESLQVFKESSLESLNNSLIYVTLYILYLVQNWEISTVGVSLELGAFLVGLNVIGDTDEVDVDLAVEGSTFESQSFTVSLDDIDL